MHDFGMLEYTIAILLGKYIMKMSKRTKFKNLLNEPCGLQFLSVDKR